MIKKSGAIQLRTRRTSRTAKKEQPAAATSPKPANEDQKLRVRMYRQGLGDCFLVTLPKKDGSRFHIMIDCGVVLGSPKPEIMRDVVKSIIADTGGYVDVLVVTHEHYDHVSGFTIAKDLF